MSTPIPMDDLTAVLEWQPSNEVDALLLAAANDLAVTMGIVASSPLYLPAVEDERHLLTLSVEELSYVVCFTSVPTLHRVVGRDGWRETTLVELVRAWPADTDGPGARCGLAVNPGTPVAVLVAPEMVPHLIPRVDPGEPIVNETERLLRDALTQADGTRLFELLASCRVLVPARALLVDGEPVVPVFTSPQRSAAFLDPLGVAVLDLRFADIVGRWPGPDHRLIVNPGSTLGFSLDGTQVMALFRSP